MELFGIFLLSQKAIVFLTHPIPNTQKTWQNIIVGGYLVKAQQKKTTSAKKVVTAKVVNLAEASVRSKTSNNTVSYKPGSLLGRRGSMVPTVQLSKRAASKIS